MPEQRRASGLSAVSGGLRHEPKPSMISRATLAFSNEAIGGNWRGDIGEKVLGLFSRRFRFKLGINSPHSRPGEPLGTVLI